MESGKPPIGNAQPVGGREKKARRERKKRHAEDLFRSYPRGRYRPSIFRPRAYRALISLAARTCRFCAKRTDLSLSLSLTLELCCIVFYLRRATDTIAERRGLPLLTLNLALLVRRIRNPTRRFIANVTLEILRYLPHHISLLFVFWQGILSKIPYTSISKKIIK